MEHDDRVRLIEQAIERFNASDLAGVAALLHPMVEWPDLMDDKLIWGPEAVLDYWERQLVVVVPRLILQQLVAVGDDLVAVSEQLVTDREDGHELLPPTLTAQRFSFRDGLISRMTTHGSLEEALARDEPKA